MTTVLILGLPGAGKSTVAEVLIERHGYSWLSASRVLRAHAQLHPEIAADWHLRWSRGEYAPDFDALPVLWEAYTRRAGRVLLDGYPRTVEQFTDFVTRGGTLDAALLLRVTRNTAVDRLRDRAAREGRADDAALVVQRRIAAEEARIEQLCALTATRRVLTVVDANASLPEVTSRVLTAMTQVTRSQLEG